MAVTDHHGVAFVPYVLAVAERLGPNRRLIVRPGIGITCGDTVRCLSICEPCAGPADWRRLLSRLDGITETDPIGHCGLTMEARFGLAAIRASSRG